MATYTKVKKVLFDGITFDSQMECDYYIELLTTYKKSDIIIQPKFMLLEKFEKNGKKHRAIEYSADFQIGNQVYDVKGFSTIQFIIKRKLFDYRYPDLDLNLVTKAPKWYGAKWIDVDLLKKMRKARKNA